MSSLIKILFQLIINLIIIHLILISIHLILIEDIKIIKMMKHNQQMNQAIYNNVSNSF